jgi:6-phosphogluconolactonase
VLYLAGYDEDDDDSPCRGIDVVEPDAEAGLVARAFIDCARNPASLAIAPDGRTLYAAHDQADGLLSAVAVEPGGTHRLLGTQPSGGAQPIHLSVHPSGRYVLSANWGSGSFAVHPVRDDGALGRMSDLVQTTKPYTHMLVTEPAGRWVLGVHYALGYVSTFELDLDAGRLRQHDVAELQAKAGPRQLAFGPGGTTFYVVNEAASTATRCALDPATGHVEPGTTVSVVPPGAAGDNYPSAILVSADGRFVYVGNRGHDSVAVLATEPDLRLLATHPSGGAFPRDLTFGADGRLIYVANERGDVLTGLRVDLTDGSLTPAGWAFSRPRPAAIVGV